MGMVYDVLHGDMVAVVIDMARPFYDEIYLSITSQF